MRLLVRREPLFDFASAGFAQELMFAKHASIVTDNGDEDQVGLWRSCCMTKDFVMVLGGLLVRCFPSQSLQEARA